MTNYSRIDDDDDADIINFGMKLTSGVGAETPRHHCCRAIVVPKFVNCLYSS